MVSMSPTVLLALLPSAQAFVNGDDGHPKATEDGMPFLRDEILETVIDWNSEQDSGDPETDDQRHFDSCRIVEGIGYINQQLTLTSDALDPANPDVFHAAVQVGRMLHGIQDFYAHANWVNLLEETWGPGGYSSTDSLFDRSTGLWATPQPLSLLRDDIVLGEVLLDPMSTELYRPPIGLTPGWTADLAEQSTIPILTGPSGETRRMLVTGWNADGACPDVRDGTVYDEYSAYWTDRTTRLVHGSTPWFGEERPCYDHYPEWVCLNKDNEDRPHWAEAMALATWQTSQAWCQALGVTHERRGLEATSILMTLFTDPDGGTAHPNGATCGPATPGPVEVKLTLESLTVSHPASNAASSDYTMALYTDDFGQSARTAFRAGRTETTLTPGESVSLCLDPTDTAVATVWGFEDEGQADFDGGDPVILGLTTTLGAPGVVDVAGGAMSARFRVDHDVTDADGDFLSACAEAWWGTSDDVEDWDDDGLLDGTEVILGTDPRLWDTDGDYIGDFYEIVWYGTDPTDADTDDDRVVDGEEIWNGTDPLHADTDGDGVDDGDERDCGSDPLNPFTQPPASDDMWCFPWGDTVTDGDGDGLDDAAEGEWGLDMLDDDTDDDKVLDGYDPSWLADLVWTLGESELAVPKGLEVDEHRKGMAELALAAEAALTDGRSAIAELDAFEGGLAGCDAKDEPSPSGCRAVAAVRTNLGG